MGLAEAFGMKAFGVKAFGVKAFGVRAFGKSFHAMMLSAENLTMAKRREV